MSTRHTVVLVAAALAAALISTATPSAQTEEADRVAEAARVLDEIQAVKDQSIPQSLLDKARAIAVFPSTIKGAFLVGAQRGKGVLSGRSTRGWSPPAFVTLTGGSVGLQIGGQATDIVLVVLNERGLTNLSSNSFKLGGDASVAAGPVGREASASTDARFQAEILSYSRSRGAFAGLSLNGSTIRADRDANRRIYGRNYTTRDIVTDGRGGQPDAVEPWLATLRRLRP
jgi:lipid-binding SYLF domain-containing protein